MSARCPLVSAAKKMSFREISMSAVLYVRQRHRVQSSRIQKPSNSQKLSMSAEIHMSARCPRGKSCPCFFSAAFGWRHQTIWHLVQYVHWRTCGLFCSNRIGHIFVRNQVVQLNKDSAVKILCGIHVGDVFYRSNDDGSFSVTEWLRLGQRKQKKGADPTYPFFLKTYQLVMKNLGA